MASGSGTNAERLMHHFSSSELAKVVLLLTNNPDAGVIQRAAKAGVNCEVLPKKVYSDGPALLERLQAAQADLVVLAGYLKLIPLEVVQAFPNRIVNIHPSLLPRHGGKGMYGMRVHQAVINDHDEWSGITIHYVDEQYDQGEVIRQESLRVQPAWSAADLAHAIHQLEYLHFSDTIEGLLQQRRELEKLDYGID